MIDYNHAKVVADESAVVSVSGTRDGIPVGPKDRVGDTDPPPVKWSDSKYGFRPEEDPGMARKIHKPAEIVAKLRQVDVLTSQGQSIPDAIRSIGVSEVTYYRWRQEYGGLKSDQVKRLKDLETENARLRKAVSDLTLDKLILQEAAKGNF
jgi:transposase-like protein